MGSRALVAGTLRLAFQILRIPFADYFLVANLPPGLPVIACGCAGESDPDPTHILLLAA